MDNFFVNGVGTVNDFGIDPSLINPNVRVVNNDYHPMNPIDNQQAVGGVDGVKPSYTDELFKPFGLGPGYEMPLGLSNYAANGNYLSSSGIQQTSSNGNTFSSAISSGFNMRELSVEARAEDTPAAVMYQNPYQAYHAGNFSSSPELENLLDANFKVAAKVLGPEDGYPNGDHMPKLPHHYYDKHQFDELISYHLASNNEPLYPNHAAPESSAVIVAPDFVPAYAPLQGSLLNSGSITNNEWYMGPPCFGLGPHEGNSFTHQNEWYMASGSFGLGAHEGISFTNEASGNISDEIRETEPHAGNPIQSENKEIILHNGSERKAATRGKYGYALDDTRRLLEYSDQYRKEHNLTKEELAKRIWDNGKKAKDDFWLRAKQIVPSRNTGSITKHVKRKICNKDTKRGRWSKQEDLELKAAVQKHGHAWAKIASETGRHQEDVRDRFRNYVGVPAHNTGRWSEEERQQLIQAINACEIEMRAEYREKTGLSDADMPREKFLNADTISKHMGNRRTRLQVISQMKKMKDDEEKAKQNQSAGATAVVVGNN